MENNNIPEQEALDFTPEEPAAIPAEPVLEQEDTYAPEQQDTVHHDMLEHPGHDEQMITADEHAMAWHGMTHPTQPEPPFDLSILDDPELDIPEDAPVPDADYETIKDEVPFEEMPIVTEESFRDQEFRDAFGDGTEFEEAFAAEEPAPVHNHPVRKGRPKRRRGEFLFNIPHLAVTAVWLVLILVIGVTLGRMLWVCAADVLAFGREDKSVTITIYEADTMEDIVDNIDPTVEIKAIIKPIYNFKAGEGE